MKKRKLKNWVKVLIIILISTIIYQKTGELGKLAQNSIIYLFLCISAWIWLFVGQFCTMYFILNK